MIQANGEKDHSLAGPPLGSFWQDGKKSIWTVLLIDSQTPVSVCPFDGEDKVKGGRDTAAESEQNKQTQKTIPLTPVNRDMKSQR